MTLVVNLFAGPGAGKSTTALGVSYALKSAHRNIELVTEVAKDFTWANRKECLRCQPLVFGKQLYRLQRLLGKVEVVVTDSPILLSVAYADTYPDSFRKSVLDIYKSFDNMNYFVKRVKPYVPIGRRQSEVSARIVDNKVLKILLDAKLKYDIIEGNDEGVKRIVYDIIKRLDDNPRTS